MFSLFALLNNLLFDRISLKPVSCCIFHSFSCVFRGQIIAAFSLTFHPLTPPAETRLPSLCSISVWFTSAALCKDSQDGGCLWPALVATVEEIKKVCVSRHHCRFISLLTALILLPGQSKLDTMSPSVSFSLAHSNYNKAPAFSMHVWAAINLSHCSIKLLRAWLNKY